MGMGQLTTAVPGVVLSNAIRDLFEVLFVVAAGGVVWSAVGKLRRREIEVVRCGRCGGPCSNAYPICKHCGAPRLRRG
jgi:hypothetical protein